MAILYGFLLLMLVTAMSLLAIPFVLKKNIVSKRFFVLGLMTTAFTILVYLGTSNRDALKLWLTSGEKHYQLLTQLDQLGGVEGVIASIKKKLEANPNDVEGWVILGKLYLSQQRYIEARLALGKAHELEPDDEQINYFYHLATDKN